MKKSKTMRSEFKKIIMDVRVERHLLQAKYKEYLTGPVLVPELAPCLDYNQENKWHDRPLWEHIAKTVDGCPVDFITRSAALFHDISKPQCAVRGKDGYLHYKGHGKLSAEMAKPILLRIGLFPDEVEKIADLIEAHDQFIEEDESFIKRLHDKLGHQQFMRLLDLRAADISAQAPLERDSRLAKVDRIRAVGRTLETDEDREAASRKEKHVCPVCYVVKGDPTQHGVPGDIRIRNGIMQTYDSQKGWVSGERVNFCPRCGRSFSWSGRVGASFAMGPYDCHLEPTERGVTLMVERFGEKVPSLHLRAQERTIANKTYAELFADIVCSSGDPNEFISESLTTPDNQDTVIMREDGKLYCRKCHCIVPNTANGEMRKEGCFAHSHVCGIRSPGEVYEDQTDT